MIELSKLGHTEVGASSGQYGMHFFFSLGVRKYFVPNQ